MVIKLLLKLHIINKIQLKSSHQNENNSCNKGAFISKSNINDTIKSILIWFT